MILTIIFADPALPPVQSNPILPLKIHYSVNKWKDKSSINMARQYNKKSIHKNKLFC